MIAFGLLVLLAQEQLTIKAAPTPEPAATTTLHLADDPHLLPTLAQVLALTPGAVIRHLGGERATLQLRGAGGHQVKVLLDGVPLEDGRGGALDLAHLPLGAVESVAVQRGAAAAAFGSGAQGGVVRLQTHHRPLQRFRLQISSFGGRAAEGVALERLGEADLLATVGAAAGAGDFAYLDANDQHRIRHNNAHGRLDGLVRLRVPLPSGGVRVLAAGLAAGRGEPGLEQFEGQAHSAVRQGLLAAAAEVAGPGGTLLGAQAHGLMRRSVYVDPAPAFAGATRRFALDDATRGLRLSGETRPARVQAGLALEARQEVAATRTRGGERPGARDEARLGGAVTGNLLWNPWDGVHAQAVLRVDDTDLRAPLLVPAAGLQVRLAPVTLRANAGRLFRDPGFDELYFEAAGLRGNPNLRPEDGWGADAGLALDRGRHHLALTGFLQRYDRLILFAPVNAWLIQPDDSHRAEARGLELAADGGWGPVRGRLAGLLQQVELADGTPLPFRPERLVRAEARWHGPVEVFGAWQWQSAVTTDPFGHRTLPARHHLDAGLAVTHGPLRAGLEVHNLLDQQRNLDAVQQPLPGRTLRLGLAWAP